MSNAIKLVVFPTKDLAASKKFLNAFLGAEPYADGDYYVGYRVGEAEVGLDPNAQHDGPIAYVDTDDIKASLKELEAAGATVVQEPKEVGGGLQIAQVQDPAGNTLGLRQGHKA
jgi:predicted enzyme related to lactoylglutathione lyase